MVLPLAVANTPPCSFTNRGWVLRALRQCDLLPGTSLAHRLARSPWPCAITPLPRVAQADGLILSRPSSTTLLSCTSSFKSSFLSSCLSHSVILSNMAGAETPPTYDMSKDGVETASSQISPESAEASTAMPRSEWAQLDHVAKVGFTPNDQRDMRRMGKKQEFRVRASRITIFS